MKRLLALLTFFFLKVNCFAQLTVSTTPSIPQIINQLQGSGVQISNVQIYCDSNAYGLFQGTSELPLTSGIAITTGRVVDIAGPADTIFANSCLSHNNLGGWTELTNNYQPTALATFDYCRIDFTIVPFGDSIKTGFVFGSEEYPIGRKNDRAGIFLTGPNPAGGQYDTLELSWIGNSSFPLCPNNVNEVAWQAFYLPNYAPAAGLNFSYSASTIYIQRSISVTPGQSYYVSISIADQEDCNYDSGLFVDGFSSDSITTGISQNSNIALMRESSFIQLYDFLGRELWSGNYLDFQAVRSNLINGNYIIRSTSQNGNVSAQKICIIK